MTHIYVQRQRMKKVLNLLNESMKDFISKTNNNKNNRNNNE